MIYFKEIFFMHQALPPKIDIKVRDYIIKKLDNIHMLGLTPWLWIEHKIKVYRQSYRIHELAANEQVLPMVGELKKTSAWQLKFIIYSKIKNLF